ncbi:MAG: c-type cytochrome [Chromatocurvus sp.]
MKMLLSSIGIVGLTLAGHVAAQQEPDALAAAAACNTCHLLEQKMVGPSYQAVAERYRNEDGAAEQVYKRMREGSQGVWGDTPMPPVDKDTLNDQELKTVVNWILSQ